MGYRSEVAIALSPNAYNNATTACNSISLDGVTHLLRFGTAAVGGHAFFAIPISAHWDFTSSTNQVAISPAISTTNINKFYRVCSCSSSCG